MHWFSIGLKITKQLPVGILYQILRSGPNQIGIPCSGPFQIGHPCSEPNPIENTCNGPNLLGNSHTCPKQSRHSSTNTTPSPQDDTPRSVPRMSNLRAISLPSDSLVLPADHLSIPLPPEAISSHISITPSFPAAIDNILWPPKVCEVVNGKALYQNNSDHPLLVKKYSLSNLILLQYVNLKICLVKRVLISWIVKWNQDYQHPPTLAGDQPWTWMNRCLKFQ